MKVNRHAKIIELINKYHIETQEELAELLKKEGFKVTQATVSRDIKELQLVKVSDESGVSRYSVMKDASVVLQGKMLSVYTHAFLSADYANNIVIVKTLSGMGQAVAAAIDSLDFEEVLGCIAGDDTIMLVCRTEKHAEEIVKVLIGLVE